MPIVPLTKLGKAGPFKYCSTEILIRMPDIGETSPSAWGDALVEFLDTKDLYEDEADGGLEMDPHVTVLYGLFDDKALKQVAQAVAGFGSVCMEIGDITCFNGDEYDVVIAQVNSQDIIDLHDRIARTVPHAVTHPFYTPHMTLAYVMPGAGGIYARKSFKYCGFYMTVDHIMFSNAQGKLTPIALS